MKTTHCPSSREILEDRIAPAGVVTVLETSPGQFTLTGDGVDNQVSVFQVAPGKFRIEGLTGTALNPGGVTSMDVTKLTKLTFFGNDGSDTLTLANLGALTSLVVDGGTGNDSTNAFNVGVKGNVDLSGGVGSDTFILDGLTTSITGNLTVNDTSESLTLNLSAAKTVIGGRLEFNGGNGTEFINAFGANSLTIGKGLDFDSGSAGSGFVQILPQISTKIGKLATGESVLFGGSEGGTLSLGGGAVTLAGGIRHNGGTSFDQLTVSSLTQTVKVGKLPTGQSILFNGGASTDTIAISIMNAMFAGGIDFNAGDGDSTFNITSSNGKIAIGKLTTGQSVKYTGGANTDSMFTDVSSLTLSGGIEFLGGNGDNTLTLNGVNGQAKFGKLPTGASIKYTGGSGADSVTVAIATLTLAGGIDFAGGDGANSVTEVAANGTAKIGKLAVGGASIKYTGGNGADTVSTTNMVLKLSGGVDFTGGAGSNSVTHSGPNGKLTVGKLASGQSLKYFGGTDSDTFNTTMANVTFAGGLEISADDGINSFTFTGNTGVLTVGKLASRQSILYTGGGGTDSLTGNQPVTTFAGGIEFSPGNGNNTLNFDTSGKTRVGTISTGQSLKYTGGNDGDQAFFGGYDVVFKGSLEMAADNGLNVLDLDGAHVSVGKTSAGVSVLFTGGTGADEIDFEDDVTLAGSLTYNGDAGADLLELTDINRLKVGGPVTFNGGAGNDTFNINAFSLSLTQGLTYTGGDDTDDFTAIADGTIGGDVTIDLGGATATDQAATLTSHNGLVSGLLLKGKLTINASGIAPSTDTLTITNVSVAKDLVASLGAGFSTVTIDNLFAGGLFNLSTGDSTDVVNIETGNFFGNSIITKLATIQTGNGANFIFIGSPAFPPNSGELDSTRVRFLAGLTLDGGADGDFTNVIASENDFPAGPGTLVITNIP